MKRVLYRFKWRKYHPQAFARFEELMRNERLSLDELMAQQEQARQKIVRCAMERAAFYRKFYADAGFETGDIGKDGWFERLPVVTKKELREHFDEFVVPESRQFLRVSTTGGSTGTPTKTGYDGRIPEEVYSWRLQNRFGVHPWDDHAYVWRDTRTGKFAQFKNAALWWPTRHLKLNASFITDEAIADFLRKFNRLKPTLLQGYVGAITQVAQYVLAHDGPRSCSCTSGRETASPLLGTWRPKVVWTTSAPLRPSNRVLIERAFGAPVCDEYGSCELRWVACQCPECKGLHVNVEHVHIEFVDEKNRPVPKGEYGRTLLTNLEDEVFPLIRYENNDRGRWLKDPCACGRTLPCIDSVKGREVEGFTLPSGKVINGEYLTTIFDAMPDVATNFRVVQHKDLSITVEYVPGSVALPESIPANFENSIGHEVKVEFRKVESIQADRGKLRFVVREGTLVDCLI